MKKLLAIAALALIPAISHAYTFYYNGVLMGTVCRMGAFYTAYPVSMAQPVGTMCPVRDPNGWVIGTGTVTME